MAKTNETKRTPVVSATIASMYRDSVSSGEDGGNWDAADGCAVTLKFSGGQELYLTARSLSNAVFYRALAHGLKQKLVDAAAISRNPETGLSATDADKYAAVKTVYDRLLMGEWNAAREGGGNAGGLLLQALCRYMPNKTPEDVRAWLETKDDKQKAALRQNPKVSAIIETIKAERVKTDGIDSDSLLDELGE